MTGVPLFETPLPVHMNLGGSLHGFEDVIGWATASYVDGRISITIDLDQEASSKLHDLAAIFELKALGFAGIKTKPKDS